MKKIFALLLVALMLLPCIASCDGGGSTVNNDDEDYTLPVGSINSRDEYLKDDAERTKEWDGKTLKILATVWTRGADPAAPWSQAELTIKAEDMKEYMSYDDEQLAATEALDLGFGRIINTSMIKRQKLIKEVYGVDLQWTNSKDNMISNIITENMANPAGEKYHIAMPRMHEAQTLVGNKCLFNLANSPSIDLNKSYFSQIARESYSVAGNTYYVAGDFSFLDEQTSHLIFFNIAMLENANILTNLYRKVENGEWTIDEMFSYARRTDFFGDTDGKTGMTDADTYGFAATGLAHYFQATGIQQVTVNSVTGEYQISLNNNNGIVDKLIDIRKAEYARTSWEGGYGAMEKAFGDGRLLFYDEVVQKFDQIKQTANLKIGVLPMPKVNADQESYYSPCTYQSALLCVPKTTPSKRMSTYFLDVLSWTGQEYIMGYTVNEDGERETNGEGYYADLATKVSDYKTEGDTLKIITDYVFPNLCYDVGYMHGWDGLMTSVQNDSFSGDENKFETAYDGVYENAAAILTEWNSNWKGGK